MATYTSKGYTAKSIINIVFRVGNKTNSNASNTQVVSGLGALFPKYDGYGYRGEQVLIINHTTAGAVQIPNVNCDVIVVVNKSIGSPTTVLGRTQTTTQYTDSIKDGKGDAATNNITFMPGNGLVDNASTYVLNGNKQAIELFFNGTDYFVK